MRGKRDREGASDAGRDQKVCTRVVPGPKPRRASTRCPLSNSTRIGFAVFIMECLRQYLTVAYPHYLRFKMQLEQTRLQVDHSETSRNRLPIRPLDRFYSTED
jgi:hypothetical protein